MDTIQERVRSILSDLPSGVQIVAVGKSRTIAELMAAVEGGAIIIGENYVQEAAVAFEAIGRKAQWHFIGHLQKNKVKQAVKIFDMVETVDSPELASEIARRCAEIGKVMPVLIEVNSGREIQKAGALQEDVVSLARHITALPALKLTGLMTMGPLILQPEECRPYFSETKRLFETIKNLDLPGVEMKYISMGMTGSYRVAVQEGANLIRIGTGVFGERKPSRDESVSHEVTGNIHHG